MNNLCDFCEGTYCGEMLCIIGNEIRVSWVLSENHRPRKEIYKDSVYTPIAYTLWGWCVLPQGAGKKAQQLL